jgi:hypothetical protein
MSQYNSQCHLIREELKKDKFIQFNVNTVVASQGIYNRNLRFHTTTKKIAIILCYSAVVIVRL